MNLQQLRYLVSVADSGSVSAAARELRVSQPVISRALRDLEREFDVELFQRNGRSLAITKAGTTVVDSARVALDAIDDVAVSARRAAAGSELVVVTTPTNGSLLSSVITSFAKQYPQTAVRLRRANDMDEVAHMVATRAAELGFGEIDNPADGETLQREPLWNASVVVVSPMDADLPAAVPLASLAASQLVLPPPGSGRRKRIDELLTTPSGRPPAPAFETDERSAWVSCAQGGIGSFLSFEAAANNLDNVALRPLDPPIEIAVGFVYRRGDTSTESDALRDLATQCIAPKGCRPLSA
jgi:DNA-binding transcriptional LysR family regulator